MNSRCRSEAGPSAPIINSRVRSEAVRFQLDSEKGCRRCCYAGSPASPAFLQSNRVIPKVLHRYSTQVALLLLRMQEYVGGLFELAQLDEAVCTYIETAWSEGKPTNSMTDALSGLQYFLAGTHRHLSESWQLSNIWRK